MKAAVLYELNTTLTVEDVILEEPKENEVLVKIAASGVCHSDLSAIHGGFNRPLPIILGHEGAGVVEKIGKNVRNVKPGDHIIISWVSPCGICEYCKNGMPELCLATEKNRVNGVLDDGTTRIKNKDGKTIYHFNEVASFAEYAVIPESAAIPIDKRMPLDLASLIGCAVMTGIGAAINTAKVEPGSTVVVIGVGGVGLNAIQGCRLSGAKKIIALDIDDNKLEFAKKFGATDIVNSMNVDPVEAVKELTGGIGVDYTFEAIGNPKTVLTGFNCLKKGGKLVMIGLATANVMINLPLYAIVAQEKTIVGSFYGAANPRIDFPKIVDLYLAGKIQLEELVGDRYSLDQVNEALEAVHNGAVGRGIIVFK